MKMQVGRDDSVMSCQGPLDKACNSRRPFQVTDVCLHRSDDQSTLIFPSLASENSTESERLDRIADRRARAVCLNKVDRQRIDARIAVDGFQ